MNKKNNDKNYIWQNF